ncbi:MAG TPA: uracil-DNA glycosylase [Terriglobia bacterium]|nr:uracil-DNA glycosylase [Terriglobia bacterium]
MEQLERERKEAVAEWLRYYRDLGFTHLYRRDSHRPAPAAETSPRSRAAAPAEAATAAFPPVRNEAARAGAASPVPLFPGLPQPARGEQSGLFTPVQKPETLEQVRQDLGDCRRCKLWEGRKTIVFGSGNPQAELVFVGEGPGAEEDEQGLPFVGRAGQLLTDMIEKGMKIPRPQVYICNIVKCRPPGNRKPERDEVAACREFVERQIAAVRPRVICALGATAAEALLGTRESMSRLRGRWHEFRGVPVMVTYHPAFLLRDPSRKGETWSDLKQILAYLNSSPAASRGG